jgi:hypothetical protein
VAESRITTLIDRAAHLFGKRGSLNSLWGEIAENFYPERNQFTRQTYLGEEFAANLSSSYPLIVRRELGNSFSAMLRPRDQEWFGITVEREDRIDRAGKEWLEWASGVQRRAMYDRVTQFVRATKEGDNDFAAFGQCVLSRELDRSAQALLYRCWHLKDVAWCERYNGSIGEVFRRWKPTVRDLCTLFPKTVHGDVKKHLEKEPYREIDCLHVVMPAEDYADPVAGKKWRTPWVSLFIDCENKHPLQEVGSWSRIYTIPRWQTVSGAPYAYSPATIAGLPDARLIQAMTLTLLEAGEVAVRPPMVAVKEVIRSDVSLYAGGITWVDAEYDERMGAALRPAYDPAHQNLPAGIELQRDTREMLTNAFYLNKLTLPPPDREMTAYETGQRIQEYIRQALPLFEPMEMEYNGALCEDTFESLMRAGAFGRPEDIPESIRGAEIRFAFESPLHEAIERRKGQKFLEAKQLLREAAEIDSASIATLDARVALREALTGIGVPAKWMRDEEVVTQMAEEQAAAKQAEEETLRVGAGAAAAKQVGEAQQALSAA